jgi:hypothetical protein
MKDVVMNRSRSLPLWLGAACLATVLVVLALLDTAPALPLIVFFLGLLVAIITGLVLCVLLLLRLLRARKRPVSGRPLLIPAAMMGASALALLAGCLVGQAPVPSSGLSPADQLAYMVRLDQRDRLSVRWLVLSRDRARRARVLELYRAGLGPEPQPLLDGAMILLHSHDSSDYRIGYEMAKLAAKTDSSGADWLSRATYDRWMLSLGKPQVYGTQLLWTK